MAAGPFSSANADTTSTLAPFAFARISGSASNPERFGISMSSNMMSTSFSSRLATAASPSDASQMMSMPSHSPSTRAKIERATTLSSTSITLIGVAATCGQLPPTAADLLRILVLQIQPRICSFDSSVSRSNGFMTYSSAPASIAA